MFLNEVLARTEERVAGLEDFPTQMPVFKRRSLKEAILSVYGRNAVIAELKYASPSLGSLGNENPPEHLAREFIRGGCTALSVLTEPFFFGGNIDNLRKVRNVSSVPVIRKDFIIDERQLYETAWMRADAVLLISRLLGPDLPSFVEISFDLGLEPLVETRTQEEVELALTTGAELIGINNRALDTLAIDLRTTMKLSGMISDEGRVVVSESGINWPYDIRCLKKYCDAYLIGSAIMSSANPGKKLEGFVFA